ncbi:MAG TPA: adenylate/guanylate cyclase domain-containing protein [Acidimicrobiales bacterium]|nr:adenylate/guanylate cyclase domain-containing protein [Acidimicrobiales bacterium]
MGKRREQQRNLLAPPSIGAALVGTAVVALSTLALSAGFLSSYRTIATDALFPRGATDSRVVVVGIDQKAIAVARERWPWSRVTQARLIDAIASRRPGAVVVDVVYDPGTNDDAVLAASLRRADAVVASLATIGSPSRRLISAHIIPPVAQVATGLTVGHAAVTPDRADGVVRSLPLLLADDDGDFVPALSLVALTRAEKLSADLVLRPHGVQVGSRYVPTDAQARLRISYSEGLTAHASRASVLSAADVLDGRLAPARLAGKIVLVGVTDPALGDRRTSPVDKSGTPGVMVHANALNTMLTRGYLVRSRDVETVVWMGALVAIAAVASMWRRLRWSVVVILLVIAAYLIVAFVRFDAGTEMDLLYPPLAALACGVGTLALRYLLEGREHKLMAKLLEQYVPAPVAKRLLRRGSAPGMPPSGTITFVFTDVVDSTAAWDEYPEAMSAAMVRHDALVEAAVEASGGALVRPRGEGDSRFGVFVQPADAARAALAITAAIAGERWKTPRPVLVRIGVHTGEAELRDFDYYGTVVNRCARIRGLAQPGEIILSSATAALVRSDLPDGSLLDRGTHPLKGLRDPEHVFALDPNVATLTV